MHLTHFVNMFDFVRENLWQVLFWICWYVQSLWYPFPPEARNEHEISLVADWRSDLHRELIRFW